MQVGVPLIEQPVLVAPFPFSHVQMFSGQETVQDLVKLTDGEWPMSQFSQFDAPFIEQEVPVVPEPFSQVQTFSEQVFPDK
jgi:hypothetical protein